MFHLSNQDGGKLLSLSPSSDPALPAALAYAKTDGTSDDKES